MAPDALKEFATSISTATWKLHPRSRDNRRSLIDAVKSAQQIIRGNRGAVFRHHRPAGRIGVGKDIWVRGCWSPRAFAGTTGLNTSLHRTSRCSVCGSAAQGLEPEKFGRQTSSISGCLCRFYKVRPLRLRELSILGFEAAMYLKQSGCHCFTAAIQSAQARSARPLPRPTATNWIAGASSMPPTTRTTHKFMRFLIPPGKRVLELGCGRGRSARRAEAILRRRRSISAPRRSPRRTPVIPICILCSATWRIRLRWQAIEGPFDYIVIADTIGMFEDIDGTLRLVASAVRAVDADHHLLLFASVGADTEAGRSAASAAASSRKSTTSPPPTFCNLMDLADFEVIRARAAAIAAAALARPRAVHQPVSSRRCPASGNCACGPISSGVRSGSFPIANSPPAFSIPCRNEKGNIENAILRMPRFGSRSGNPVRRGQFQRRHLRGMRAGPRCLSG